MMASKFDQFLAEFVKRPAATHTAIVECERALGRNLPGDYLEFMRYANGGEGFIGNRSYCSLFAVEDLHNFNVGYEVSTFIPGFLLIGSDGGGEAFGFDTREDCWKYIQIPFIPFDWEYARPLGTTFTEFLTCLSQMQ